MILALIYTRFSSSKQREESTSAQARACRAYCQAKGYTVVAVYSDEATTGTNDDRPQFQAAMAAARAGQVDVFVVHKLDRWARDSIDDALNLRELQRADVRLESVAEGIDLTRPSGFLMRGIYTALNDFYSRNLADEVMKGHKETAAQAKHNGGRPALGFDLDREKHYTINEHEAKAVRLIFQMVDAGAGYTKILDRLKEGGHRTKEGKPFGRNSLNAILSNEKYAGTYTYNKTRERVRGLPRSMARKKPAEEVIRIPGAVPAIISREVFDRVQAKLADRAKPRVKGQQTAKVVYLLSGLVTCSQCKGRYVGNSARGGRYHYYECGTRQRTRTCSGRRIPKQELEDKVLAELRKAVFSRKGREQIVTALLDYARTREATAGQETGFLVKEIGRVQKAIDNLAAAVEQGAYSPSLADKLAAREAELAALKGQLDRAKNIHRLKYTRRMIEDFLDQHFADLKGEDDDQKKAIVQEMITEVRIEGDDVAVDLIISLEASGVGEGT